LIQSHIEEKSEKTGVFKLLRRVCLLDLRGIKESMSSRIQKMVELRNLEPSDILIDSDYLFRLRENLTKYCSVNNQSGGDPSVKGSAQSLKHNNLGTSSEKKLHRMVSPKEKRPIIFENVQNFKRNQLADRNELTTQMEFTENGSYIDTGSLNQPKEFYDYPSGGLGSGTKLVQTKRGNNAQPHVEPIFEEFCSATLHQGSVETMPNFPQSSTKLPFKKPAGPTHWEGALGSAGSRTGENNKGIAATSNQNGAGQSFPASLSSSLHSNMIMNKASQDPTQQGLSIRCEDYFLKFAPRKYLHFFQNNENILHMLDYQSFLHRGKTEFESSQLNIDFAIPKFHKSLTLPTGELYLLGGSSPENSMQKSSAIYKYLFDKNTLIKVATLQHPRSSHAICYHHPYIIIVGGLTTNLQVLSSCEMFNTENNEISKMGNLKVPTASACVASFSQKYIFKFGGIGEGQSLSQSVEKYDFILKKWEILDPRISLGSNPEFLLLSAATCIQINEKEILVLGGYDESNNGSSQTFSFSVENFSLKGESYVIKKINHYPLPWCEGFWNSAIMVYGRKLYCLQNVEDPINKDCLEDKRAILIFDGKEWEVY
jgi:hypothetical protein